VLFRSVYEFLRQYGNTMFGNSLRQTWLDYLAKQGDWAGFIQAYTPQKSAALQCYYVQARLAIRQATQEALEEAKQLWLVVGKSQPTACNVAFDYLAQSGILTTELIWQRIELDMAKYNLIFFINTFLSFTNSSNLG
jgi:soluble lytic murein transglycosylase